MITLQDPVCPDCNGTNTVCFAEGTGFYVYECGDCGNDFLIDIEEEE